MTATPDLTIEQKLARVIEAQTEGGSAIFAGYVPEDVEGDGVWFEGDSDDDEPMHFLPILLDPVGLKAAYGDHYGTVAYRDGVLTDARWKAVAQHILWAWLASEGDPASAIEAAFTLLL